ncbi:Na+/H+ antiporter subunit E [Streptomyces griseoviridis]|uniref:Na+/H+ antiporter subunit E n=3 Tax=Streptomyces TaxID=1883 RepID=A0A918GF98_STRGD|nr:MULTISPECIES: Na+/H+ antiporter subunit E [Streptomyces]MDP9685607.1 multicomponent Na+:H+ antiporter subunit E [Streptomyces griseoviridis]GGS31799.1 Na+/H+ antiporter subunit E [Streptomyces niveoruber]GGS88676.1 Na+/H+ antiporter subunit E [Streptomyces griseoviridis]GGU29309.1 Na+/H+ antiporter subunit E [Streptomyces daghestanicus]GHI34898.1 Na+/H+ antiporter subunit E [Streptomyces daghestanicus]
MSNLFRDRSPYSWSLRVGTGRRVLDLPLIAWLTVIWNLLWGTLSWGNLVNGVLVAVAVCLAFPLPAVDLGLRLRPLGILRLGAYLLYDMFSSSVQVTRQIFADDPYHAAVVAVPLRSRSDLMLTATAVAVSNVPGGSIIEVRRATATVFLHVLDADDPGAIDSARRSVRRTEELVARAFGTAEDIARVARPAPDPEGDPSP